MNLSTNYAVELIFLDICKGEKVIGRLNVKSKSFGEYVED